MKKGDSVRWTDTSGGNHRAIVIGTKGTQAHVEYGSGNKVTRKWLPMSILRVMEPR